MSVTNTLGQLTSFDRYDSNGHVLQTTDPNGLVTTLTYTPRGWLQSRTRGTETTTYSYDFAGNLLQVQFPSGETTTYTYDAAHRLTDITDPDGNHLHTTWTAWATAPRSRSSIRPTRCSTPTVASSML